MQRSRGLNIRSVNRILALLFAAAASLPCQTTQGLISGQAVDSVSGNAIPGVEVRYTKADDNSRHTVQTDASGLYTFAELSPGLYRLQASHPDYQSQDLQELRLSVASFLHVEFRLRPIKDVWEKGQYRSVFLDGSVVVTFKGPDVDTTKTASFNGEIGARGGLESTVSEVIDSTLLRQLPLASRDAYTMLVTQPGVTSDGATTRSLGLSAAGQRPSASEFLLDGVGNNNLLVTGPLSRLPPEALREYRISTNNYSAEYGGTSGFLANGVSRVGGSQWHGLAYLYGKNDLFDAVGPKRIPYREIQPGFSGGGPLVLKNLFASFSAEYLSVNTRFAPENFLVPSRAFIGAIKPGTIAHSLFDAYRPPGGSYFNPDLNLIFVEPPANTERLFVLPRLDYLPPGGVHRFMARTVINRLTEPDLQYSPYPGFEVRPRENSVSTVLSWVAVPRRMSNLTNEARLAIGTDDFRVERPHHDVPKLSLQQETFAGAPISIALPGSQATYSYRNRSRGLELSENFTLVHDRHIFKAGAGLLERRIDGYIALNADREVDFNSLSDLANDRAYEIIGAAQRGLNAPRATPDFNREYRVGQWHAYAQDSFEATSRLTLSYGVRYEYFGVPDNVGATKDSILVLGQGGDLPDRIRTAGFAPSPAGNQRLYSPDRQDWSLRTGLSFNLRRNARTVIRASYGIFYDQPFDNLWQDLRNNSFVPMNLHPAVPITHYTASFDSLIPCCPGDSPDTRTDITVYVDKIRTPRVQSAFAGVQHAITGRLSVEANVLGSKSDDLITSDRINRQGSVPDNTQFQRFNNTLPNLVYRANQGRMNYRALTTVLRYRGSHNLFQASYTLSHAKDNQSDPLTGLYFDFSFAPNPLSSLNAFARQFQPMSDWGNADYDQRHNLVFFSIWELPGPLRGWRFSQMAAFRSGFPFTVYGPTDFPLLHNPANLVAPGLLYANREPAGAGIQFINQAAFAPALPGILGDSGRNHFYGPGLYNFDLSLNRRFRLAFAGESAALNLRADVFNALNHANLDNPVVTTLNMDDFGVSGYGRRSGSAFSLPLTENRRQVQVMLQFEF